MRTRSLGDFLGDHSVLSVTLGLACFISGGYVALLAIGGISIFSLNFSTANPSSNALWVFWIAGGMSVLGLFGALIILWEGLGGDRLEGRVADSRAGKALAIAAAPFRRAGRFIVEDGPTVLLGALGLALYGGAALGICFWLWSTFIA